MNIDANISEPYSRVRQNEVRHHKLTSKFRFDLRDENFNKDKSDNPLEKGITENLWKLYTRTKELLPYKERMENLTWRLMFVNNQPDYKRAWGQESEPKSSFSSSEVTSSSVSPSLDEFDYKSHVQRTVQERNTNNSTINSNPNSYSIGDTNETRRRLADLSSLINSIKPHSNLSTSLAAVKNELLNPQFENAGAISFQLDLMAFERPALNISESFHSSNRSQTPTMHVDTRNHTPSPASQNSLLMQIENITDINSHFSSFLDSHYSSSSPLNTVGPSAILNGINHNHSNLETQNNSMVSLAEHFRSQSNTPFTNQLCNQNISNFENTPQNPPYPLVHTNSFIIQQSSGLNIPNSLSLTPIYRHTV